jgi:hypothetical protein
MPTLPFFRAIGATLFSAAALAGAATPAASAADVSVPGKCYVYWPGQGAQAIPVNLSGLAPAQSVKVSLLVKDQLVSGIPSLTADTTGSVVSAISPWTSGLKDGPTRSTKASVVVNDLATGAEVASTGFKVANVGFKIDGRKKRAGTKRDWEISGLASVGESLGGGKVYYAYYFSGTKQVGKQRLGKAQDACGYMKAKKVLIPFKKRGVFNMKIQASRTWKGDNLPWIGGVVESSVTYR